MLNVQCSMFNDLHFHFDNMFSFHERNDVASDGLPINTNAFHTLLVAIRILDGDEIFGTTESALHGVFLGMVG